jgi:HK97 family phage prohead protease
MPDKLVSLDEYLNAPGGYGLQRKHFARDSGVILKGAPAAEIKAVKFDEATRSAVFVMSAEIEDRDRDIIVQAGLDTTNFEKNPIALFAHNPTLPIGKWADLTKNLTGRPKRTEGRSILAEGVAKADEAAALLKSDTLRACSIGFMPKSIERREVPDDKKDDYYYPGYLIHEAELYECSLVSVPANPAALAKAAAAGDRWSLEDIEVILDGWSKQHGLFLPRAALEEAHREGAGNKQTITVSIDAKQAVADLEQVRDDAEKAEGALSRLAKLLGLKREEAPAEAAPEPPPPPAKSAEEQTREQMEKDLPALVSMHEIIEADAELARLDAEMGRHAPK